MGKVYVTSDSGVETGTPIESISGVTVGDVLSYVGAGETDTAYANECLHEAWELLYEYLQVTTVRQNDSQYTYYPVPGDSTVWYTPAPPNIMDRAILEVSSELFHRKNAPSGIQQFQPDGVPVRLARDPMTGTYPMLHKYVVPF